MSRLPHARRRRRPQGQARSPPRRPQRADKATARSPTTPASARVAPTIRELAGEGRQGRSCSPISGGRRASACRKCRSKPIVPARGRDRSGGRSPSPRTASGHRRRGRRRRRWRTAACCSWRTPASTQARRRTIRSSPQRSPSSATSTSTMRSPPRTARTPRPRVWRTCCPPYAGRAMQAELEALDRRRWRTPKRPVVAIVGGAKISTKIELPRDLVEQGRCARDRRRHGEHASCSPRATQIGKSLAEPDLADTARRIMAAGREGGLRNRAAVDVVVADDFKAGRAEHETVTLDASRPPTR